MEGGAIYGWMYGNIIMMITMNDDHRWQWWFMNDDHKQWLWMIKMNGHECSQMMMDMIDEHKWWWCLVKMNDHEY